MLIYPICANDRIPEFPIKTWSPTTRIIYIKRFVTILSKIAVPINIFNA